MYKPLASRIIVATSLVFALGVGCGSATGGACGGLQPLPKDPQPFGFPTDQLIEGGLQARITKGGMMKLSAAIPQLITSAIGGAQCVIPEGSTLGGLVSYCTNSVPACPGGHGCGGTFVFNSKDRPVPF